MRTPRVFLLVLLMVTLAGAASQSFAAYQVFLRLDGLPGASTDAEHRGWIDCATFDVTLAYNELDGTVQPTKEMRIIRRPDGTSRALTDACARGAYIKWACLAVRRVGPGAPIGDYFLATFFKNSIGAYCATGTPTGPAETLSLNFGSVVWQFRPPVVAKQAFGPLETGGYRGSTGQCYPHAGFEEWTGRRLGDPRVPLPMPPAFPVVAARVLPAGRP